MKICLAQPQLQLLFQLQLNSTGFLLTNPIDKQTLLISKPTPENCDDLCCLFQVTENNSISLAQFDYLIKFTVEYREAIDSGEVRVLSLGFLVGCYGLGVWWVL